MKMAVRVLVVIFILLIVGVVVALLSLNRIVKKGVETVGPAMAKVEVKVKDVDLSPFSGSGKVQGLLVGNPSGFKTPSAIQVGVVGMKVEPRSLMGDKIIVRSLRMEAPEITFEGDLKGNNLSKILENVQGTEEKAPATKEEAKAKSRKLQVDDFVLTGAKVNVNSPLLAGKTATVTIPDIHLANLGQGPEGITPAELTKRVLKEVLDGTLKSVGSNLGDLTKGVTEGLKNVSTNAVEGATKKIGDLFKKK
ncbi:MAG TPA: hypothetical protein VJ063_17265 [Verrucomicrobiae bacterium]|nr:hypothetical protein [Verrucomicrobiae bacterium]